MKRTATILMIGLGAFSCFAAGAEQAKPVLPDYDYCARRDADPEKCVIQNGPPRRHIVRRRQSASMAQPVPQPSAESQSASP